MGAMCTKSDAAAPSKPGGGAADAERTPAQKRYPYNWPVGADQVGYLTERQVKSRLKTQSESTVDLGDGYTFRWAAASQRGYYPSQADKANQDAFAVHVDMNSPGKHWFAVYDGHGPVGEKCSGFACEHVAKEFTKLLKEGKPANKAMSEAHVRTNRMLAASAAIDDQQSGTTAITMYMDGRKVLVSNVGDSRVMLGTTDAGGKLVAKALSTDQTPYRRDERERVKAYGARVMTADQIDGVEPIHENWDCKLGDEIDDGGDPPRIWAQDQEYPGTAFTRSIGDSLAESVGVVAEPELDTHQIGAGDRVLIAASDGIFEFITTKQCVETALLYADPLEACKALVGESYKLWIEREDRTDDITIILGYVEGPGSPKRGGVGLGDVDVNIPHAATPHASSPGDGKKGKTRRGSLGVNK
jgi:cGMP-dependent protein kinase